MSNKISFKAYREKANQLYGHEGDIQIGSNARVSRGADNGAYVQAWVWVSDCEFDEQLPESIGRDGSIAV